MFEAQCNAAAASRKQFQPALVGHWTMTKSALKVKRSRLSAVDESGTRLVWVWSLQPEVCDKNVRCA